jgi:hypothetical protein
MGLSKNNPSNFINLGGQSFGRLVVLSQSENSKGGEARWLCRCICGVEKSVIGSSLRSGKTTSCGCYRRENLKSIHKQKYLSFLDLTGQRFTHLIVLHFLYKKIYSINPQSGRRFSATYWLCKCSCGEVCVVRGNRLRSGHTKSCGHLVGESRRRLNYKQWIVNLHHICSKCGNAKRLYIHRGHHKSICTKCRASYAIARKDLPAVVEQLRAGRARWRASRKLRREALMVSMKEVSSVY